jgi:hypothetical protein
MSFRLECKHLVLQLADWSGLGEAQSIGSLLHGADHWWWPTEQELDIGCGLREPVLPKLV